MIIFRLLVLVLGSKQSARVFSSNVITKWERSFYKTETLITKRKNKQLTQFHCTVPEIVQQSLYEMEPLTFIDAH